MGCRRSTVDAPEVLPTLAEIAEPTRWLDRVA